MDARFRKIANFIVENEGGYVDHPNDPGGATKYGVSLRFYKGLKPGATKEDIKSLTMEDAFDIYHREWYRRYNYHEIESDMVAKKIFDLSVNMGPARAHRLLQRAVNLVKRKDLLDIDGIIGPITIKKVNLVDAVKLVDYLAILACNYYISLCDNNSDNYAFIVGWITRALKETGLKLGGYNDH